jgi:hypothetical protein
MSKKRRQYSPQFKSKVALEAIQGVKTVPELSSHQQCSSEPDQPVETASRGECERLV